MGEFISKLFFYKGTSTETSTDDLHYTVISVKGSNTEYTDNTKLINYRGISYTVEENTSVTI